VFLSLKKLLKSSKNDSPKMASSQEKNSIGKKVHFSHDARETQSLEKNIRKLSQALHDNKPNQEAKVDIQATDVQSLEEKILTLSKALRDNHPHQQEQVSVTVVQAIPPKHRRRAHKRRPQFR
jgi:hypothetical protein